MGMSFVNCPPFLDIHGLDTVLHCFCQLLMKQGELANVFYTGIYPDNTCSHPFHLLRTRILRTLRLVFDNSIVPTVVACSSYPTTHVTSAIWKSSPPNAPP